MSDPKLLIIIGAVVVIVIVVAVLLSRKGGGSPRAIPESVFQSLEKKHQVWKKETMLDAVKTTFEILKKNFENRRSQVDTDVMTINIYRDLFSNVIPKIDKLTFIKYATLEGAEIVRIMTARDENRNSFTVKLELQGEVPPDISKSIYWTFIRSANKWLLSEMHEDPVQPGYFPFK
ncbi:MAG: hypothetical protein RDV48_11450 [Candidatus Eremiobacteraeota bacterium]|nr:hypothetical protein [Candidatus Eremiobacteraeota bacterium]